ncbi:hypothetical protein ACGFNP_34230 [Nonomuraea sp. NPDC049269]|uniref:hypothetical protein n=1 Tax=Nonomuraea sp. NPDC049269 TaxID=3364349 RepID=UPI00372354D3
MSLRLLRFVVAAGVLTLAIGLGKLVDGDVRAGLPLFVVGLVLAGVPAGLLIRQVIAGWMPDFRRSPAMADPTLRRNFRSVAVFLIAYSVPWFLAAFAILVSAYRIPHDNGSSAGAIVAVMVVGCFIAGIPTLLGIQFLRCGQLVLHGATDGIAPGLRLGWIVVVIGGLATVGSLADDRPGYGMVALVAGCLVAVTLVSNLRLLMLNARVIEYERQARAPRPTTSDT